MKTVLISFLNLEASTPYELWSKYSKKKNKKKVFLEEN